MAIRACLPVPVLHIHLLFATKLSELRRSCSTDVAQLLHVIYDTAVCCN